MKVAVFGAGAIGCWVGGRLLANEAADVTLIGRVRVLSELRDGLALSDLSGAKWNVLPSLSESTGVAKSADVVLVTVKSAQTEEVARELVGAKGLIISLQNGVHNADILRAALPENTVLAGMVPFNVARIGYGAYHRGTSGDLMIEAHPTLEPLLLAAKAAGLAIETRGDMPAVQWGKLVMNLNNAINALSGRPLRDELADRDFRRCLAAAQKEALDVIEAAKLPVATLMKLPPRWVARILPMPDFLFEKIANRVASVDPAARSSMQDDFIAGRPTEIDYLQGEIVKLAAQYKRPAPVNQKLVELVRAAEAGGKRDFSGSELYAALGRP
ncbi:MAG: 2-dehydropantoate 2-reductase [Kofleriaceae bacterium]